MLYTDVYTAAHLLGCTTANVYRCVNNGQAPTIQGGKKRLIALSWVTERTGRKGDDLAAEIDATDGLCLLDIGKKPARKARKPEATRMDKRDSDFVALAEEVALLHRCGYRVDPFIMLLLCVGYVKSERAEARIWEAILGLLDRDKQPDKMRDYPWEEVARDMNQGEVTKRNEKEKD